MKKLTLALALILGLFAQYAEASPVSAQGPSAILDALIAAPDCQSVGGTQSLNYTAATPAFTCNTITGGGGGGGSGTVNSGTTGQVGYYAASGTAVSGESLTALFDSAYCNTFGRVLVRYASVWTCDSSLSLNVKWVGAAGDGTTDDTSAINAAISALSASPHPKIYFPQGTYIATSGGVTGLASLNNIDIGGDGAQSSFIKIKGSTTPTAELLHFSSNTNVRIHDIGFDGNNVTSTFAVVSFINFNNIEITHAAFINNYNIALSIDSGTNYTVSDNYFYFPTPNTGRGYALNVTDDASVATSGKITGNYINGETIDILATNTAITNNEILNSHFGSGIVTEQSPNSHDLYIAFNRLHCECTSIDVNSTRVTGIENWAKNTTIEGNLTYNNSGDGINNGGQNSRVVNNISYNNNESGGTNGAGITARYGSSTYNSNGSIYQGNTAFGQVWGYYEESSSLANIQLGVNNWSGNTSGSTSILSSSTLGLKMALTGNATFYISAAGNTPAGNDSNDCLTAATPCLTSQHVWDMLAANYDLAGHTATIQYADATYSSALNAQKPVTGGSAANIIFNGNSGTPTNVFISVTSTDAFAANGPLIGFTVQNMKLKTTTGGSCLNAEFGGSIFVGAGINFNGCASAAMQADTAGASIRTNANYTVSGGGNYLWAAWSTGIIKDVGHTVTISGTPAFSPAAVSNSNGNLILYGQTFSGSATGQRYSISLNSVINVNGAATTYLPGNSAGATATGAQYQ